MTLIIIGIIVLLIFVAANGKRTPKKEYKKTTASPDDAQQKKIDEIFNHSYKKRMSTSSGDDSIIDVTGEKYQLPQQQTAYSSYNNTNEQNYNYLAQYWGLGTKYKSKLRLSDDEVSTLDALIVTDNKFNSIEFIAIELIRLFFDSLNHLEDEFKKNGTSVEQQTNLVAELELTQRYRLWKDSRSYISQLPVFANSIKQAIYKICENSLRDLFFIGRKTDLKYYIYSTDAMIEFDNRFNKVIQDYIPKRLLELGNCDDQTEVQLNEYSKARWKAKLDLIKDNWGGSDFTGFYNSIIRLGEQNSRNPAVENIFFDASKFIAKSDKLTALKLYVHYVYYDLLSVTFDNKHLAKTIQKSLFSNDQQLREFESIINTLIADKKIAGAIESVSNIYTPKRKKIQLNTSKIKEVQEKHSDTVELLNEYLQEEEDLPNIAGSEATNEEVSLEINYTSTRERVSIYKNCEQLSEVQEEALNLFSKRGFLISNAEFDIFVKSKGVFKNSLLESINEVYFDVLDDVLIEENEEEITINETYYNKIVNS